MMEDPATKDLTGLFQDATLIYKCCCTEVRWGTYCKLIRDIKRGRTCSRHSLLNIKFRQWNKMPATERLKMERNSEEENNWGKCVVAGSDPLLAEVMSDNTA